MKHIILSSHGFSKNSHLQDQIQNLLDTNTSKLFAVVLTTASAEWKEKNKHAVAAKDVLEKMGFSKVDFLDIEFEDPKRLRDYAVIYINGGNPFYLLHHLRKSGADSILTGVASKGTVIVGVSGGGMVLGPDIDIAQYFDAQSNTTHLTELKGLNLVKQVIYPHYSKEAEQKIQTFEKTTGRIVTRLSNTESIVVED